MGTWATGLVVGSLAGAWSAVLGWLGRRAGPRPPSVARGASARRIAA